MRSEKEIRDEMQSLMEKRYPLNGKLPDFWLDMDRRLEALRWVLNEPS